ncbi:MAG TPA: hypothetical protein VFZ65_08960, partial [Planctomycetota bacterium]|nr:hypothetical protein [Planctomycetota bacterium]
AVCLRFCLVKREDRADHEVELRPDRMVWSRDGTMTCTWTSCRAGAHRVVVRRRGHDEPLHTVDVDVRSNAAKELRLPPMAVPALRVLHIHVPAAGAGYLWPAPVSEMVGTKRCESAVRDGDATWILASNAPTDLFVSVAGHRHVTLRGVDADMDVALAPGIPVVFECDLGERPPRERVTLTLVGDHEDEAVGATVRGGRAAVVAPAPGAYWLHAEGWPRASDFHCDPESVVVDDTGGTFRIVLRPEAR